VLAENAPCARPWSLSGCADGDDGHGCWADEAAEAESDAGAEKAVDVFKGG